MEQIEKEIFLLEDIIEDYKIIKDYESLEELSLKNLLDIFEEETGENQLLELIGNKLIKLREEKKKLTI